MTQLQKQELRQTNRKKWREEIQSTGKRAFLSSQLPKVLSAAERKQQQLARKQKTKQKKWALAGKLRPSRMFRPSRKLRASRSQKPTLKTKPSLTQKPCKVEQAKLKDARKNTFLRMGAAVNKLAKLAKSVDMRAKQSRLPSSFQSPTGFREATPSRESLGSSPVQKSAATPDFLSVAKQAMETLLEVQATLVQTEREEERACAEQQALLTLQDTLREASKEKREEVMQMLSEHLSLPVDDVRAACQASLAWSKQPSSEKLSNAPPDSCIAKEATAKAAEGEPPRKTMKLELGEPPLPAPAEEPPQGEPPAASASLAEAVQRDTDNPLAASLAVPPPEAAERKYVIISSELAPAKMRGKRGLLIKETDEDFHFVPEVERGNPGNLVVKKSLCLRITEVEAKRATLPWARKCLSMRATLATFIFDDLMFKPCEIVPEADLTYELAQDQVDCGIAEMLWRLLPGPGFAVIPAGLTHYVLASQEMTYGEKTGQYEEKERCLADFLKRVKKGRVVCMPIFNAIHWTLLVLEKKLSAASASSSSSSGFINALGSSNVAARHKAEDLQFQTATWPDCDQEGFWQVRYYDTLPKALESSYRQAEGVLKLLAPMGVPQERPVRRHFERQRDNTSCGRWVLHYLEEEARVWLGELPATFSPDLEYRARRLNAFGLAMVTRVGQDKTELGQFAKAMVVASSSK